MVRFRQAGSADVERVAALHADSWRRHYRGALSDAFLDGDVEEALLSMWRERLAGGAAPSATVLAEDPDGTLAGLTHVIFDEDPRWGALLDNLHVAHSHQRRGLGARLMALSAEAVLARPRPTPLHLWVLEQNENARAFYEAQGGEHVETTSVPAPGGVPGRLNGTPLRLRYVWPDPSVLAARSPAGS